MIFQGILERRGSEIVLSDDSQLSWLDFGVQNPLTLVAKLGPRVVVTYLGLIPKNNPTKENKGLA